MPNSTINRRVVCNAKVTRQQFEDEYIALLLRATSLGYTMPTPGRQSADNAFLAIQKSIGVWAKHDVFYNLSGETSNFSTLNWKNPALYQITKVNSPGFTVKKGFNGNGASSYLDTNFNLALNSVNYQRNNASAVCYMDTVDDSNGGLKFFFGAIDNNYAAQLAEDNTPNSMRPDINGNNSAPISAAKIGAHWLAANRDSAAQVKIFQDDALTTGNDASNGLPNGSMTLLVRGDLYGYTNRKMSMFSMGSNLVAENASYKAAWLNYFNLL